MIPDMARGIYIGDALVVVRATDWRITVGRLVDVAAYEVGSGQDADEIKEWLAQRPRVLALYPRGVE